MKRHYLLGLMLLLPPLQVKAAEPTLQEVFFLTAATIASGTGICLIADPKLEAADHYRGVALTGAGISAIVFYKQILSIAK